MEAHALFQHEVESHWLIGAMVLAPLTKGPRRQQPAGERRGESFDTGSSQVMDLVMTLGREAQNRRHRTHPPWRSCGRQVRSRNATPYGATGLVGRQPMPGSPQAAGIAMAFKLIESAPAWWRAINALHLGRPRMQS